jgi:sulfite reductase (ferredoxin)
MDGERYIDPEAPRPEPPLVPTPGDDAVEPLYGKAYLPRKFKTAFGLPEDNCVDLYANDLGFLAIHEAGTLVGYNVLVGGGMGTTPSAAKTFAAVAQPIGFVPRADYLRVAEAILKVFRDFGNRSDRKRARLKYVLHDMGVPAFKAQVESYLGAPIAPPQLTPALEVQDHLGWNEQGNGKLWLGLPIENGRIHDGPDHTIQTALREYFEAYRTPARLTCQQSILLADIDPAHREAIDRHFRSHGVPMVDTISTLRRWSMACPALPTCGLAVTESERVLPTLLDEFDRELARLGLSNERVTLHMTGCPNGCARPYNTEIGLVGRSASKTDEGGNEAGTYTIFLGGRATGERLNAMYKDYVPFNQIVPTLSPLLSQFAVERQPCESFGDFCHRMQFATDDDVVATSD